MAIGLFSGSLVLEETKTTYKKNREQKSSRKNDREEQC